MANVLYSKAKEAFLSGNIDLINDNLKVLLIDTNDYTPNFTTDEFKSTIDAAVGAEISVTGNMSSKDVTGGVFDAADTIFLAVSGDISEAVIIYQDTGTPATSRLIAYIDTATGLPVTPNGGNINILWDNGVNKIFAL